MSDHVLVVGGAGYIGSHCAKQLAEEGFVPVTYDNLSSGWKDAVRFGPLVHGDIRDAAQLHQTFKKYKPRAVFHFAAKIEVGESMKDPIKYYQNNVAGSINLLQVCSEHDIESFVFSSTAAVYGMPEKVPVPLDAKLAPINPYGASKVMIEQALHDVVRCTERFGGTCFRYFNAAGAHPDGDIGERHEPESHLIPNALKAAVQGKEMFLFGDDYPTPDGTCVRDYIHVVDLVSAHVAALKKPPAPGELRRFNLGTGAGLSVKQVLDTCGKVTGSPIKVTQKPRRPGDAPELVAGDTERAREVLDWSPRYADVESIVSHAWKWQQRLEALRSR